MNLKRGIGVLLLGLACHGCGSSKNQTSGVSSGSPISQGQSIRLTVPAAMITARTAKAVSESKSLNPAEKVDPEKIPRFFHASRLDSREPNRPAVFETQFDVAGGAAQMSLPGKSQGGRGLWQVSFNGATQELKSLLPAFWWKTPTQGIAITPQSTLWVEVAEAYQEKRPGKLPHADVWALIGSFPFDPGEPKSSTWRKRKSQLLTWMMSAMDRFPNSRPPAGAMVYGPLVALSLTPLLGDPKGEIASLALVNWHKGVMEMAQRAMTVQGQGKPQIRSEAVVAPLARLNQAPSTQEDWAKNLKSLEIIVSQTGPWPFEESPGAEEAGILSFKDAISPKKVAPAIPPKTPPPPPKPMPIPPRRPISPSQPVGPRPVLTPSRPLTGSQRLPLPASPSRVLST